MRSELKAVLGWWVAIILMALVVWVSMAIFLSVTYAQHPPWMGQHPYKGFESPTARLELAKVWHDVRLLHETFKADPDIEVAALMLKHEATSSFMLVAAYRIWFGSTWSHWVILDKYLEGIEPGPLKVMGAAKYSVLQAWYYRQEI